jgi:hypothetical protein
MKANTIKKTTNNIVDAKQESRSSIKSPFNKATKEKS